MYTKGTCEIIIALSTEEDVNEAVRIYYGGIDWAGDKLDIEGVNGNSNDIDISDEDKTMSVYAYWQTGIDFSNYNEQEKKDWIITEIREVAYDNIRSQTNLNIDSVDVKNLDIRETIEATNKEIEVDDEVVVIKEGKCKGETGIVEDKSWDKNYWRDVGGELVYIVRFPFKANKNYDYVDEGDKPEFGYCEFIESEIELVDKIEGAYKFKTKMAPYLMLDVIGTATAEAIATVAKKKFNMPNEIYSKIFNSADVIGDKFVAKMTKFFETDEKFNKKLSSTSGEVALNYAYMWAKHWIGKLIEEEVPEAKPFMQQMANDRYFWDKPLEAKEKKECEQCNDMVDKLTYYDNLDGTDIPGNVCDSCLYMNKVTEIYNSVFDMVFDNDYYYGKDYKKLYDNAKTDIERIAIKFSEMAYEEVKQSKKNIEEIMQKMIDGSQPGNYMDENQVLMDAYDFVMGTDSNADEPFGIYKDRSLEASNNYSDYELTIYNWIKENYGKESGEKLEYFDRNSKEWFDHGVTIEEAEEYIMENFKIKGSQDIATLRKQMEDKINETGEILWDIIEDDMVIEWGFDLSDIKAEDWINILKEIGAKSEAKYDDKNEWFIWKGKDIKIITSNNPITGQPAAKRRDRLENYEKDYVGYVGVQGYKKEVKKFVELFLENANIKDMSILRRNFI